MQSIPGVPVSLCTCSHPQCPPYEHPQGYQELQNTQQGLQACVDYLAELQVSLWLVGVGLLAAAKHWYIMMSIKL